MMKRASTFYFIASAAVLMIGSTAAFAQFPRNVLIEEFTSVTCKPCTTATPILNKIIREKNGRVVSIRYHLNFPSPGDPWYAANTAHNEARKTYYNAVALPFGRADGSVQLAVTQEGDVYDKVEDRLAIESPITLLVTQTRSNNQANVMVTATSGDQEVDGNYKLHVVAVEAHIHYEGFQQEPFNKEKDFEDVMRMMIPGPEGTDFSIGANAEKSFPFSYTIGEGWQPDQIYVIAFVQDDVTKEIIQVGYSVKPTVGVDAPEAMPGYSLMESLPNPTRNEVVVRYSLGSREDVKIDLYGIAGDKVMTLDDGAREAGDHATRLDLRGLPTGVYTYVVRAGAFRRAQNVTLVR